MCRLTVPEFVRLTSGTPNQKGVHSWKRVTRTDYSRVSSCPLFETTHTDPSGLLPPPSCPDIDWWSQGRVEGKHPRGVESDE